MASAEAAADANQASAEADAAAAQAQKAPRKPTGTALDADQAATDNAESRCR